MGKQNGFILAGDIGGTKTYLGLFIDKGQALGLVREDSFINANFDSPEAIIRAFLGEGMDVKSAFFGIACPVEGNRCSLTNLPWIVDGEAIKKRFGIGELKLINDLVATASGVELLKEKDFYVLQAGVEREGNRALIAAGTGLGEAIMFWDGKELMPSGSEGGHADFAPRNRTEIELLEYLIGKYGHVSYERVISGPGLVNIYNFVSGRKGEAERIKKRFEQEDASAVIAEEAEAGTDGNCRDALNLFLSAYGAEAGNLALKSMSSGGLYIGGGIAPKLLKGLKSPVFMDAFRKKGRFEELLSRMPVRVILNPKTGLMGAALCAARAISSGGKRSLSSIDFG
ncbi:MAG: glucokinase [Deltaproteobacteria bacterium]|nr:glucokinase [Deltaproteobacteria bacterium]